MALALAGVSIASNWWALTLLIFSFFGGSGAYDLGINAAAINLEHWNKQPALSKLYPWNIRATLDRSGSSRWALPAARRHPACRRSHYEKAAVKLGAKARGQF